MNRFAPLEAEVYENRRLILLLFQYVNVLRQDIIRLQANQDDMLNRITRMEGNIRESIRESVKESVRESVISIRESIREINQNIQEIKAKLN